MRLHKTPCALAHLPTQGNAQGDHALQTGKTLHITREALSGHVLFVSEADEAGSRPLQVSLVLATGWPMAEASYAIR